MNDNLVFPFIICVFLVIITVIMYLTAYITGVKMKKYKKVKGVVTFKKTGMVRADDTDIPVAYYYYEYEYEGTKYEIKKSMNTNTTLKVGESIDIYINEKKPNKYLNPHIVQDRKKIMGYAQLGWIPLAFIILILFVF